MCKTGDSLYDKPDNSIWNKLRVNVRCCFVLFKAPTPIQTQTLEVYIEFIARGHGCEVEQRKCGGGTQGITGTPSMFHHIQ